MNGILRLTSWEEENPLNSIGNTKWFFSNFSHQDVYLKCFLTLYVWNDIKIMDQNTTPIKCDVAMQL